MKYLLIITALVTAIIAIKGKTWDSEKNGINGITVSGWAVAFFAVITAFVSIYVEYSEQSFKAEKKVESEYKRFHTLEQLVDDIHQIELLAFEFEKASDISQVLVKVQLHTKFIKDAIELHSNLLTPEELLNFEEFIRLSNEEIAERESGSDFMNNCPMPELARFAREIRFRLCDPLIGESPYCSYLQSNPTANEFFAHEDPRMLEAISQAKNSLPEALKNIPELKNENTELLVKVAIPVGDGTREHIWLGNVSYSSNKIVGEISNEPVGALHVNFGQKYISELDDVSDWMAIRNGVVYGGYMLRVNLSRMSEYELDIFFTAFKYKIPKEIMVL